MKRRNGARIGLTAALALAAASAAAAPAKIDIVAFGLWGDQSVFASEAEGAARVIAHQFGPVDKVIVRANTKRGGEATEDNLRATLAELGAKMDPERDLLFLVLTSHGDPEGIGVETPRADVADHADRAAHDAARERRAPQRRHRFGLLFRGLRRRDGRARHAGHHRRRRRPRFVRLSRRRQVDELRRGVLQRRAGQDASRCPPLSRWRAASSPNASRRKDSTRPIRRWPAGAGCCSCSAISQTPR